MKIVLDEYVDDNRQTVVRATAEKDGVEFGAETPMAPEVQGLRSLRKCRNSAYAWVLDAIQSEIEKDHASTPQKS